MLIRRSIESYVEIGGGEGLQKAITFLNDLLNKNASENVNDEKQHFENEHFNLEASDNLDHRENYKIQNKSTDEDDDGYDEESSKTNEIHVRDGVPSKNNAWENKFNDVHKEAHFEHNTLYEDFSQLKTHDRTNLSNVELNVYSKTQCQDNCCGFKNDDFFQNPAPQRYATLEKLGEYNWEKFYSFKTLDSTFQVEDNLYNKESKYGQQNLTHRENESSPETNCLLNVANLTEKDEHSVEAFDIEHSLHCRLIGVRGMQVKRLMQQFQVVVRFADRKSHNPHQVLVTGKKERVEACKMFLLSLAKHALQGKPQRSLMLQTMDPNNTFLVNNYLYCNLYNPHFFQ